MIWSNKSRTLKRAIDICERVSGQPGQTSDNVRTELPLKTRQLPLDESRIPRQQHEHAAIFQTLGGVPLRHNTSAQKYFRNIRSCGAKTQMIWTRQKERQWVD